MMNNDMTGLLNLAYEIEGLLLLRINRGDETPSEMKDWDDNMWTSSMMKTLYLPCWGGTFTCSIRLRMSSTLLLDAASSSIRLKELPLVIAMQESHSPQASPSGVGARQLIVRANMRAQEVLPTPRGPQNRYAWASRPEEIEFFSVAVRFFCPTTVANDAGRYLRALTI